MIYILFIIAFGSLLWAIVDAVEIRNDVDFGIYLLLISGAILLTIYLLPLLI